MKEFKDYHLYYGCEVILVNDISEDYGDDSYDAPAVGSIGTLDLINNSFQINCQVECEDWPYGVRFKDSYICFWDTKDFKLLLRPLPDITEEEKQGLKYSFYQDTKEWRFPPESFAYLLSKHFDLFGLIEAGLAIDATTLETSKNVMP